MPPKKMERETGLKPTCLFQGLNFLMNEGIIKFNGHLTARKEMADLDTQKNWEKNSDTSMSGSMNSSNTSARIIEHTDTTTEGSKK